MRVGVSYTGSIALFFRAGGIDFVDVVKHSVPMVGKTLVAGAGELAGTMKETVINTIMSDSQ